MAEGFDANVVSYQTTNLELNNLFSIIVNSLRQLLYCIVRKDPFDKKHNPGDRLNKQKTLLIKRNYQIIRYICVIMMRSRKLSR